MFCLRASTLCVSSVLLLGCAPTPPPAPPPAAAPAPSIAATQAASVAASASASVAVPVEPIRMVPGVASEPPVPMPSVAIVSPKPGEVVALDKLADFKIKLDVKDWATEKGGRHVHLILDNKPYKPIYDTSAPVSLSELNGGPPAEGEHVLVAFPSRPNHESVKPDKGKAPLAVVAFWVGKKGKPSFDPKAPMFIYSRPKGAYEGPKHTERLLVDFYMNNMPAGAEQWTIALSLVGPGADGLKPMPLQLWQPYVIENLRNGEYKLTMELLDKQGHPIPGAWNKATRSITVNRDLADDNMKAGTPPSGASGEHH
jgi:hypothetical protein